MVDDLRYVRSVKRFWKGTTLNREIMGKEKSTTFKTTI